MDSAKVISYLELLAKNNVFLVALAGGDPFLHPEIENIIRRVVALRMLPLLACNPSQELERNIPLLKELKVRTVQFSLDSSVESQHDESRGAGSFKDTFSMIRRLSDEGVKSNLSVCITTLNAQQVEEVIDLADRVSIFKLKLVFWQSDGIAGDWGVGEAEKLALARRISQLKCSRPIAEWVALPDFDLTRGVPMRYSMPELIVSADGNVSSSDFSSVICRIDEPGLKQKFEAYVEARKSSFLQRIIDENIGELGKEVVFLDVDLKRKAAAAILACNDKYHVFVDKSLPPLMREISILHEIGHIKTGTLSSKPGQGESAYIAAEGAANEWLLSQIQDNLEPTVREKLGSASDFDFTTKLASSIRSKLYIF